MRTNVSQSLLLLLLFSFFLYFFLTCLLTDFLPSFLSFLLFLFYPVLDSAIQAAAGVINAAAVKIKRSKLNLQTQLINKEATHEAYQKTLLKFTSTFDSQLAEFLEKLWAASHRHHPQLSNLCVRLDYNGFYTTKFSSGQSGDISQASAGPAGMTTPGASFFNISS